MSTPLLHSLAPVRGSGRLIAMRWLLSIAVALPGTLIGASAIGDALGRRPFYAESSGPMPLLTLIGFVGGIPGAAWGALIAGAAIGWVANLMLTAAAVETLDPEPSAAGDRPGSRLRVGRRFLDTGRKFRWPYLRVALTALVAIALGGRVIVLIFERLSVHGQLAGWTGATLAIRLPAAQAALFLAWSGIVGALALWCRVILVADDRRRTRRLWPIAVRLAWRRMASALLFHWLLSLLSLSLAGVVLFAWRQSPVPGTPWFAGWLGVLLVQAFVWHWRLRACRLVWAGPGLDDLRRTRDEPWHFLRKAWSSIRSRIGRPAERGSRSVATDSE